jgi:hypothetical protein
MYGTLKEIRFEESRAPKAFYENLVPDFYWNH